MGRLLAASRLSLLLTLAIATSLSHAVMVSQVVPTLVDPNLLGAVTQTTVTIQAPVCSPLDNSSKAGSLASANLVLFVVAVATTATNINNELITGSTIGTDLKYQGSEAGTKSWYVALGGQTLPVCSNPPPSLKSSASYYRMGNNTQCTTEVNCNGPLKAGINYWFKYVVGTQDANGAISAAYLESSWSKSIQLHKAGDLNSIGVTPGPRSGGMVVVTVILVLLLFLSLIAAALLFIASRFMRASEADVEKSPMKNTKEPSHGANNRGRYTDETDIPGRRNPGFSAEPLPAREPTHALKAVAPPVTRPPHDDDTDDQMEVATHADSGLDTFSPDDSFRMQVMQSPETGDQDIDGDDLYATDIKKAKALA